MIGLKISEGVTMRTRNSRYGHREEIKDMSNRHNNLKYMHPQVRSVLQHEDQEIEEGVTIYFNQEKSISEKDLTKTPRSIIMGEY
jgi:hypothetical protein